MRILERCRPLAWPSQSDDQPAACPDGASDGDALLRRSTRAISLTDTGRRYFERVRPIVRDAELAQAEALAEHATPSGTLKIAAPVAYGQHVLAPKLFAFQQRYSAVRLNLHLSDELVNVVAGGFDLVIRLGRLDDSELVSRQLGRMDMRLVASRDYLERAGTPRTTAELANHRGILTRTDLDHWTIDSQSVRVLWHICTGNMLVTHDAVCAGLGIAMVPGFLADAAIGECACPPPLQMITGAEFWARKFEFGLQRVRRLFPRSAPGDKFGHLGSRSGCLFGDDAMRVVTSDLQEAIVAI